MLTRLPFVCCVALALLLLLAAKERPLGTGVRCVAFSPSGACLAAGVGEPGERGLVVLWDVASQRQLWSQPEEDGVPALAFSPDGKTLLIGTYAHKAKLLEAATGRALKVFEGHKGYVRAVAFAPDGKTIATASWDKTVRLWDRMTGMERLSFEWPTERIYSLSFSPSGRWLLGCGGNFARVWDVADEREKNTVHPYATSAAVFVDNNWFLTGGGDGTIRLWNSATGGQTLKIHDIGGVERVAFSAAARLIAETYSFGYNIELFSFTLAPPTPAEAKRLRELVILLDHDDYDVREKASRDVLALGFVVEPELRRLMKEAESVEARIRARVLREELLTKSRARFVGHTDRVDGLAFNPRGDILASASHDGTIRFWRMADFKESARLTPKRP